MVYGKIRSGDAGPFLSPRNDSHVFEGWAFEGVDPPSDRDHPGARAVRCRPGDGPAGRRGDRNRQPHTARDAAGRHRVPHLGAEPRLHQNLPREPTASRGVGQEPRHPRASVRLDRPRRAGPPAGRTRRRRPGCLPRTHPSGARRRGSDVDDRLRDRTRSGRRSQGVVHLPQTLDARARRRGNGLAGEARREGFRGLQPVRHRERHGASVRHHGLRRSAARHAAVLPAPRPGLPGRAPAHAGRPTARARKGRGDILGRPPGADAPCPPFRSRAAGADHDRDHDAGDRLRSRDDGSWVHPSQGLHRRAGRRAVPLGAGRRHLHHAGAPLDHRGQHRSLR